jgi:hypothetical protein
MEINAVQAAAENCNTRNYFQKISDNPTSPNSKQQAQSKTKT